jgi:hypothetical protein
MKTINKKEGAVKNLVSNLCLLTARINAVEVTRNN